MKRKTISIFTLSAIVALAGVMAFEEFGPTAQIHSSAVMLKVTPTDAIQQADYAISGEITNMEAKRVTIGYGDSDLVLTTVTLSVDEDLFRTHDKSTIQFTIEGGEADKLIMTAEHSPELEIGEKILVFLNESDPKQYPFHDGHYLVGQAQSAYEIRGNTIVDKYSNTEYSKSTVLSQIQTIRG